MGEGVEGGSGRERGWMGEGVEGGSGRGRGSMATVNKAMLPLKHKLLGALLPENLGLGKGRGNPRDLKPCSTI